MEHIFILNIFTLKNTLNILEKKIKSVCDNKGITYKIEVNSDDISTEDIVRKYKKKKVILHPVGGDGMINRVLNCMDLDNNILCPVPYGTGNDLCRTIRRQLKDGISKVDIVKINNKYFINSACFGIDSDIANSSIIRNKYIPKSMKYNVSAINSLFKYKLKSFKVYINEEIYSGYMSTIAICNGMYYGGGYKIAPHSKLDDGKIDVYVVDKMPKLKMLVLMLGMNAGKHEESSKVKRIQCKELSIECEENIKANIDGETIDGNKFNIKIIENGISLYYDNKLINELIN